MFDAQILLKIAKSFKGVFEELGQIEHQLNERFTGMEEAVQALVLSVAGGEPLLLIGPPGTAKSRLIRAFCGLIGLVDEDRVDQAHDRYFEYLLTPFTEPAELFGFYDIPKAIDEKVMSRLDKGMMQHAEVVYLDEIFNGSSAILNSILTFLNERVFHDHGVRRMVKMECLFGATNDVPDSPELRAVFDRFVLRCQVDNISAAPDAIGSLLSKGWRETFGSHRDHHYPNLLDRLRKLRQTLKILTDSGQLRPEPQSQFYKKMAQQVQHARQYELSEMSNRRLVKMLYIMLIHRLYRYVVEQEKGSDPELAERELTLLPRFFLDRQDEALTRKMIAAAGI